MFLVRRIIRVLPLILLITACLPASALAGGREATAGRCPTGTICDPTLGLALVPPPGWLLLPPGKYPPHTLAFGTLPSSGLDYTIRLIVEPVAITSLQNSSRSVRLVATKLIRAEAVKAVTEQSVTYAGAPGLLLRGLPGPSPAADILLGRGRYVYQIIVPGMTIAPDQVQALATLRFIPRSGFFLGAHGG